MLGLDVGAEGPSSSLLSPLTAAEPEGGLPEQEPGAPGAFQQQTPKVVGGRLGGYTGVSWGLDPNTLLFPPGALCVA